MKQSGRRRRLLTAALLVVLFGFAMLFSHYGPYALEALDARSRAPHLIDEASTIKPEDVNAPRLASLRQDVETLGGEIVSLGDLIENDPLVRLAGQIPSVHKVIADTRGLLEAGAKLTVGAEMALDLGDRFVNLRNSSGSGGRSLLGGVVNIMATSRDEVDQFYDLLVSARASVDSIDPDAPSVIRKPADTMIAGLDRFQPLVAQYRAIDETLPGILGWGGQRRYLVLAQDPAELRPTGGYIGTVGTVTFKDASLVDQQFKDVYQIDLLPGAPYVEPPEPLSNHLIGDASWQLADSNWSPDFSTAAQQAMLLYTQESGDASIDGVIGITTYALDRILAVTGPIEVPGYNVTVKSGDVTLVALAQTRGVSTANSDRKAFLDALATNAIDHLYSLPPGQWKDLWQAFVDISRQRQLLVWFRDPQAESLVAQGPIGGSLREDPGDYLYVVEANMAPTSKYNLAVRRSDSLSVSLSSTGDATNHLELGWQNNAATPGEPYSSLRSYSTSITGLYGAYVRAYVPAASQLISARGMAIDPIERPESIELDLGRNVFGNYLLMPPGNASLIYDYTTPAVATKTGDVWTYRLTVQKQPGLRATMVSVHVALPAGAQIVDVTTGATVDNGAVDFSATSGGDMGLTVDYRLP